MVKFLIERPIAVIMAFLAVVILGCVTFATLPVSLLPDVAIPHITVQVSGDNMSARELDNTVVAPLRRQLMQLTGLSQLKSEARAGAAIINLTMNYGTDTDLAYVEVNEKIDAAMGALPRSVERPTVVKASATDIPVLYLHITDKSNGDDAAFMQLSGIAENIVRRRLEQLPEVAMVDITGVPAKQLRIVQLDERMKATGLSTADIESALAANNAEPGSMTVRDEYYEYNIHVANQLRTPDDVKEIKLTKNGRIYSLGDLCTVELTEKEATGYSAYGGQRAVTMVIIKNQAAGMEALEKAVESSVANFAAQYPDIEFSTSRSQTELLDFTISNLEQNLILGLILMFVVCVVFMRSFRLPFVIGITVVVSVIITFLIFFLFKVSINIISLAGLILAVGMMIDNSVIVAENISQYRLRGFSADQSCIDGTNEMITPLLSSSLTTIAVFVPLVFMSGIAGALFADQAFSITAGLMSSYLVGIMLMPVLYRLFFKQKNIPAPTGDNSTTWALERWYTHGIDRTYKHKTSVIIFVSLAIAAIYPLLCVLDTERMPRLGTSETMLTIDWNEDITADENLNRCSALVLAVTTMLAENSLFAGPQDFMLNSRRNLAESEAELYLRCPSPDSLVSLKEKLAARLSAAYPRASFAFSAPDNVFEKVFSSDEMPLEARMSIKSLSTPSAIKIADEIRNHVERKAGIQTPAAPLREQLDIKLDHERLAIYDVDAAEVQNVLQHAFHGTDATVLRSFQEHIPIQIKDSDKSKDEILATTLVRSRRSIDGQPIEIPLRALVTTSWTKDLKTVTADNSGPYIPLPYEVEANEAPAVIAAINEAARQHSNIDVAVTGSLFSNMKMMKELLVILLVSLLLMYFILCAQLESFLQPLIILLEIPVDISFALLSLWFFGQTINLMSAIGMIVTCGIVVNDSILKIDAIDQLRRQGLPLLEAIHTAGIRRLKPILMTSLTTIFAIVPVLFTSDMGSELQQPLAVAMIGSMLAGTLVSIFFIPLIYFLTYRKRHVTP